MWQSGKQTNIPTTIMRICLRFCREGWLGISNSGNSGGLGYGGRRPIGLRIYHKEQERSKTNREKEKAD